MFERKVYDVFSYFDKFPILYLVLILIVCLLIIIISKKKNIKIFKWSPFKGFEIEFFKEEEEKKKVK